MCQSIWVTCHCAYWYGFTFISRFLATLQLHPNGCDGVSNHQSHDCLLNRLFRHRSKKTTKLRVTYLCAGNSRVTGDFPAQISSNAENVSIWWRHHEHRLARSALRASMRRKSSKETVMLIDFDLLFDDSIFYYRTIDPYPDIIHPDANHLRLCPVGHYPPVTLTQESKWLK